MDGGFLNKQAAAVPGISEVTLETHRRNLMRKMATPSLTDPISSASQDASVLRPRAGG